MQILSSVSQSVNSQISGSTEWIVTPGALIRFLSGVYELVSPQISSLTEWLAALRTIVALFSSVGCDMGS